MYAVIASGGKQYRVQPGETLRLEKLDVEQGKHIEFTDILMIADGENVKVGTPHVAGASVKAEVLGEQKGEKLLIYKFRRRKGYRRKTGHRQKYTAVKIVEITG